MAKTFKLTLYYSALSSPIDDVERLTEEFPELKLMTVVDYKNDKRGSYVEFKVPIKIKQNVELYLEKTGHTNASWR